ncbi:ABC transporter permease [Acidilutibacter cellobiosedens]|jgi:simple sugar transport system permease protein|uniref:ABC transporter permease n=2 Tax=Tissierellales TaxID=1737405 RepID=A0A410QCV0_9FIRM|nr:ABC transporter permease [Acidilutibacter cellobiosedens]MBE6082916.1 ABC transporter permease [Tissierellaceae bacterium]QAT61816.1 ABC transporter permease [Acidilutibacter cellobiosedens]
MVAIKEFVKKFGWPRIIIALFLLSLFVIAPFFGVRVDTSFNDVITRFGMNAIMVLSMVPMIQSGCGLNFGIPVGLIAGMIGAVVSLELNLAGFAGILMAFLIGIAIAAVFGFFYGLLLNRVKGDEMIIATYVGFSFVFFMNMMWLVLPFRNPASVQGFKGEGLRVTISVENYWFHQISNFLKIDISNYLTIPTGMILIFAVMSLIVWGFFKTKTGTAITAVGSNPDYARASGISIDKMRIISVMLSTMIAAVGMIVYEQSFGFIQMYNSPLAFSFPSVAAVLLGGASVNKASIGNVIIGTLLFQGILTMTPSVINSAINIDISEIIRIIVSNGMIVYALTRKGRR